MGEVLAPLKSLWVTVCNKMILGKNLKGKKKPTKKPPSFLMCLLLSSDMGFLCLYKFSVLNYTPTTGMA